MYPESDTEDEADDIDCEVSPVKPLVDYPLSPVLSEPHALYHDIDTPTSSWVDLVNENVRLQAELECARGEAEAYKAQTRILEEQLRAVHDKIATNQKSVPSLLDALVRINTMADEAMQDDT